jgi:hypothetical protein
VQFRQHPPGEIDFRGANLLFAKAGEDPYRPYFQQRCGRFSANLDSNEDGNPNGTERQPIVVGSIRRRPWAED